MSKTDSNPGAPAHSAGKSAPRFRRFRRFLRWCLAALALCALVAAWRVTSRFPASWERRLSDALSSDSVSAEVGGVSFSVARMRLKVDSFALYPRAGERRAALALSGAELRLRPRSLTPGLGWLREVRVSSLEFDAGALSSIPAGSGGGAQMPEFAPVRIYIRRAAGIGLEVREFGGNLASANGEISLEGATASFNWRGEPEQTLRGNVYVEPSAPAVYASGAGSLDFAKLVPALQALDCAGIAGELEKFEFPVAPPDVEVTLCWAPARQTRSLGVSVHSGPMRYNGVRVSGLSGVVRVGGAGSWGSVEIDPLEIKREEGAANGRIAIDTGDGTLSFDCVSTMDPPSLAALIGLVDPADFPDIGFEAPCEIRSSGTWGMGDGGDGRTAIRFSLAAPGVTARGVRFSDLSVAGGMKGRVLDIPEISAGAMDGSLSGSLLMDNGGTNSHVAVAADLRDAKIFRIPLFAGLTDVLAKFVPGVDFLVSQSEAHVRATLDDGRWNISGFGISGAAFSVDGSGTAAADGTGLDLVARVRLMNRRTWLGRRLRALLSPLSGLFGVRATGSVASPRWAMAPFSKSSAK